MSLQIQTKLVKWHAFTLEHKGDAPFFMLFFLSHKQKIEGDVVLEKIVPWVGHTVSNVLIVIKLQLSFSFYKMHLKASKLETTSLKTDLHCL